MTSPPGSKSQDRYHPRIVLISRTFTGDDLTLSQTVRWQQCLGECVGLSCEVGFGNNYFGAFVIAAGPGISIQISTRHRPPAIPIAPLRSEERRVGKEC